MTIVFILYTLKMQMSLYDYYEGLNRERIPQTVVYKHNKITTKYNETTDSYSIIATEDIDEGEILMIEEGIIGPERDIVNILKQPKYQQIAQELYPRKRNVSSYLPRGKDKWIMDKVLHNHWDWYEPGDNKQMKGWSGLFPYISRFNHSCSPTATIARFLHKKNNKKENTGYFVVFASGDLFKDDEIYLSYGDDIGHGHVIFNWNCNCGLYYKERKHYFENNIKRAEHYLIQKVDEIQALIDISDTTTY